VRRYRPDHHVDRTKEIERNLLTPQIDDPELVTHYWEIYDRRRRLKRLSDFASSSEADVASSRATASRTASALPAGDGFGLLAIAYAAK
jgi:hypothetical protein